MPAATGIVSCGAVRKVWISSPVSASYAWRSYAPVVEEEGRITT
jgi:hypothetical protein